MTPYRKNPRSQGEWKTYSSTLFHQIRSMLIERTRKKRVSHVMGVEGMAIVLAQRWQVDHGKTLASALLHDLAKCLTLEEQRTKLEACHIIPATPEDYEYKNVWHGKVAAQEAHDLFGITDHDVLEAIAHHSTGCRNLSQPGLVLYIADFIEPSRKWDGAEDCRREVLGLPLHEAARTVARQKLVHLDKKKMKPHSQTSEMLAWLNSMEQPST